jgi:hypothetical protein
MLNDAPPSLPTGNRQLRPYALNILGSDPNPHTGLEENFPQLTETKEGQN